MLPLVLMAASLILRYLSASHSKPARPKALQFWRHEFSEKYQGKVAVSFGTYLSVSDHDNGQLERADVLPVKPRILEQLAECVTSRRSESRSGSAAIDDDMPGQGVELVPDDIDDLHQRTARSSRLRHTADQSSFTPTT